MPQRIRTFIAVEVDPAIRRAAGKLIDEFRKSDADVKWVDANNLHLTVKFLGDVDAEDVAPVCSAVERAVADMSPFQLRIRGVGAFPNVRRPQTIWLGADEGSERMAELAERIEKAVEEFGFRRETRQFRSHLTLGRLRREGRGSGNLSVLLEQFASYEAGLMPVEEVVVFSSQLRPGGPIYQSMGRGELAGK